MDMRSFFLGAVLAFAVTSLSADAQQARKPLLESIKCPAVPIPFFMENSTSEKQLSFIIEELATVQAELCDVVRSTSDTALAIYETRR